MRNSLRSTLAALLMGSVAALPLAAVTLTAGTGAAFAKDKKEKKEKREKRQRKSRKSKAKSDRGRGSARVQKQRKATAQASAPRRKATQAETCDTATSECETDLAALHPSELGNMNGALNASPNAVAAHIRNGNHNGPVGAMAALVVARVGAEEADATLARAENFADLDAALKDAGYASVEDYYAAQEGREGIEPIPEVEAVLNDPDATAAERLAAVNRAGFDDVAAYDAALRLPGAEPVAAIDDAIDALGADPAAREPIALDRPDDADVLAAEEALVSEEEAEAALLELWNKGNAESENAEDLMQMIDARIEGYGDLGVEPEAGAGSEDAAACEAADGVCDEDDVTSG